jgi:ferredoxin-NADP reductase
MNNERYDVKMHQRTQISKNTILLDFRFIDNKDYKSFNFIAGQFIQLFFVVDGKEYRRSYSIANSPENFKHTNSLEIALSFVENGKASEFFAKAEVGTLIKIRGPFGLLILPATVSGNLVFIGTGTGLAPYRSMLQNLTVDFLKNYSATIISGFRYGSEAIFQQEFNNYHNIKKVVCLSRDTDIKSYQYIKGRVQQGVKLLNLNPKTDTVYLCGNPSMIDDLLKFFKELKFTSKQIKREKYIYSGH